MAVRRRTAFSSVASKSKVMTANSRFRRPRLWDLGALVLLVPIASSSAAERRQSHRTCSSWPGVDHPRDE